MNISLVTADSKSAFLAQLHTIINERLNGAEAEAVRAFADRYYERYPTEELDGRKLSDVYGNTYAWWDLLQQFDASAPKIRVFNPSLEEDGWLCGHTVIAVLQRDMPFLVDSVRMEMNRRNIVVHTIQSSVFPTRRNDKHELIDLPAADAKLKDAKNSHCQQEALVYLEINLHTSEREMAALAASIASVLQDVSVVVDDYQPLLAQMEKVDKNLVLAEQGPLAEIITESRDFLHWLAGHFTVMGYSEYEFVGDGEERALRENPAARLGLFRGRSETVDSLAEADFNPGMTRFHLTPQVLGFTKSAVRSRVHRYAYSDYVIVKRYDKKGQVCGESRFLGLYTSPVYTLSPTRIPVIRRKVADVIERSGLNPSSHDGKALRLVLETFPRDELFQSSSSELFETVMGVARINERYMVRLFMRRDPYGKFVNCMVYVPRDIFSTRTREDLQQLISADLGAQECEFTTYFSESILARVHLVFKVDPAQRTEIDVKRLEAKIVNATRTWEDCLAESLGEAHGEEKASRLYREYASAFSNAYKEDFEARSAVQDIATLTGLATERDIAMSFYRPVGSQNNELRFKVFHLNKALELSDCIPVLEHLGLRVLGEHPYRIRRASGDLVWLHDFNLAYGAKVEVDVHAAKNYFQEAFEAIWSGRAESDAFNRLILGARLNWREVGILRAYARYMKQTAFNFSQSYIANTLANHLEITRDLVALFKSRFDPRLNQQKGKGSERAQRLHDKLIASLDKVSNLNEDRIVRRYVAMIEATLRTNFFQRDESGEPKDYLSLKLSPGQIPEVPEPRPQFEIFVYSPRVEGVHLRGGKVARGGIRWSDRQQDYRTEVLGLVKAQQVKNAVIVPNGAKGGFVGKKLPASSDREAFQKEGIECYKTFIRGLLDVTDNLIQGEVVPPKQLVRRDEDDPYMVVAADKGTASFSDIANGISEEYGHWLGDAFASGGGQGYDHKRMGITARGAWVSVQRHFRERGLDVQNEDFTVIGVGDMGGDVFGNGMLLSEHIRLLAAFNHMHIFVDPNPDAAPSFAERQRLFDMPRSSWSDYKTALISKGGGVFERSAKSIAISPEMKKRFDITADRLTPAELIRALLLAPVDLLWNGGIGTYVKSESETHAQVGDKAGDSLRVNGKQMRCRVFGEGGNLGMTQLGRIEFCRNGGACNTDFIDNAAGVDCSDHEVNIKILLDSVVARGDMTVKQRNQLLEDMTDTVAGLVLDNNYRQTQAISICEYQAGNRVGEYRRFINNLEASGRLDRELEFLPTDEQILERNAQGDTLTRPELSVMVSYAKVMLKDELANSDVPADSYMATAVEAAFPPELRERFAELMGSHILRDAIVATQVANDMVNHMGINFCLRLMETTGSNPGQVAKAYVMARDIYGLADYWGAVEALDHKVPSELQMDLMLMMIGRVRRATRWFLRNRRGRLNPAAEVKTFGAPVRQLIEALPKLLRGETRRDWEAAYTQLVEKGVPEALARQAVMPANLYSGLGMVEAAEQSGANIVQVAEVLLALGDKLELLWFANQIAELKVTGHWQAMARETFMADLESQMCDITVSLIRLAGKEFSVDEAIERWSEQHQVLIERWHGMISELQSASGTDFAMFSVALRELLDLAQASQHCESFGDGSVACVGVA